MARSQSDGERENEGLASDAARASLLDFLAPRAKVERASLGSFLTPPPSSRRSDAPPSTKSKAAAANAPASDSGRGFWDSPVPRSSRRSSVAPHGTVSSDAPSVDSEDTPPVLATRPAVPDAREIPDEPVAPTAIAVAEDEHAEQLSTRDFISTPVPGHLSAVRASASAPRADTPSTLAPSAYDTSAGDREVDEDSEPAGLREGPAARSPFRGVMLGLSAAAAVLLIVAGLALRKRSGSPAAAVSAPEPEKTKVEMATEAAPMELGAIIEESAPPAPVDPAMARELQQRARELLVAGQVVEGVLFARRAIAADPMDSDSYILLAAGLQDLGRWDEARNIFSQCVRRSGGPATTECRYFATQGN
jgi:hypothetical protein